MAIETELKRLIASSTNLTGHINVTKASLDADVLTTTNNALATDATLASANAISSVASAQDAIASANETTAEANYDSVMSAWNAYSANAEVLSGISQSLHFGTIVDSCIDLPSTHSDGGAWTDRCQDKSWYTEALGGDRWIGQRATVAAAWAAAGSAVGAVFQATATAGPLVVGRFYQATSSTTVTEVFRGIKREYPKAGVLWIAESARVVGYDLGTGAMWRTSSKAAGDNDFTCIAATQGVVLLGMGTAANNASGVYRLNLIADSTWRYLALSGIYALQGLHTTTTGTTQLSTTTQLVSQLVNDIAITVLPGAPIDPATGLPVPTIAVATAGGVSVIKHDGTVQSTLATGSQTLQIEFLGNTLVAIAQTRIRCHWDLSTSLPVGGVGHLNNYWSKVYWSGSIPATLENGAAQKLSRLGVACNLGLTKLKEHPVTQAKDMVAYITNTYNTGWLPGDIRGAWLADTVAETVTGATLLSDDFSGYADAAALQAAWTSSNSTLTLSNGTMRVTSVAGGYSYGGKAFATEIGKAYVFEMLVVEKSTSSAAGMWAGNGIDAGISSAYAVAGFVARFTYTATSTTTWVTCVLGWGTPPGGYAAFDAVLVKLASPDRSIKNNDLILNGTLTKAAVASASALVAYSGFSAANYLEQPYNANLDFGTGDFCVMGWANVNSLSGVQVLLARGSVGAGMLGLYLSTSTIKYWCSSSGAGVDSAIAISTGLHFLCLKRVSGVLSIFLDGSQVYAAANVENVTNVAAILKVGANLDNSSPALSSLALWRVSATAPTADQIAQIYRDELPLFQPNAQCTIAGSSTAVTALSHDDTTDLLHVGTSWGISTFEGLSRISSEATGAVTSISSAGGSLLVNGNLSTPPMRIREKATSVLKDIQSFEYDAIAAQTTFVLPKGFTVRMVSVNGTVKRKGTTKDYTVSSDGYQETVTFNVAPGAAAYVLITATI